MNTKFKTLIQLFQRLPGVGPRQAARFVIFLLEHPEESLLEFGTAIKSLKRDVSFCDECFNISENHLLDSAQNDLAELELQSRRPESYQTDHNCHICHDAKRDRSKLMVVEKITDLESVEKTGLYKGLYHVLGGAINPLDKITPANLKIKELEKRLKKISEGQEVELIIATNPNTPGETTALYLHELFANIKSVSITRLGRGLSSGSHLEYADETTIKHAMEYRK